MLSLIFFALTFSGNFNVLLSEGNPETRLLHVQCLFRHGARAPISEYSPVNETEELWPNGLGHLTKLGKQQQFVLGLMLKNFYENFTTSNPSEVQAHSSGIDRCLVSAEMNLAAFYAPDPEWTVIDGLNWQPIPIHYKPKSDDKYLYPFHHCPCASKANLLLYVVMDDYIKETYQGFYEEISKDSGHEVKNFEEFIYFGDVFNVREIHNLPNPKWVENHWPIINDLNEKYNTWYSYEPVLQKLRAGPFLKKLIEIMLKKHKGELQGNKVQIYASHDIVISTVLAAAGLWNGVHPPYCATVLFELHERIEDNTPLVRFLYLNSTKPELGYEKIHVLTLPGCDEFCPLEYFINHVKHIIPENWDRDCKTSHASKNETCGEEWFEKMEPL